MLQYQPLLTMAHRSDLPMRSFLQASNPEQRPTASGSSSASSAKGKKRAKEPSPSLHQSLQHPQRASKRQKRDSTGSYNLRPRVSDPEPATASHSAQTTKMAPKKAAPSSPTSASANVGASMAKGKGKGKGRAARGSSAKMQTSASASQAECSHENESQSDIHERRAVVKDEDVEMRDDTGAEVDGEDAAEAEGLEDENNDDEDEDLDPEASGDGMEEENEEDDDDDDDDGDEGDEGPYDDDGDDGYEGARDGGAGGAYGLNLRAMAGYMSGLSSRFRTLLSSLRARKDPTAQLVALQELSELLSVSTEDTLAGYFPTDAYVKELIYLMGGPKPRDSSAAESSSGDDNAAKVEEDEETATANAAASAGLEDNGETMLLACRCLANLMEAMPYAAHSVVSNGAVPVLNEKLMEIQFIDLAEQVLQVSVAPFLSLNLKVNTDCLLLLDDAVTDIGKNLD